MKAIDFEYDGKFLSDFGCIICTFDSNGLETINSGSEISFQTTSVQNGKRYLITNSIYSSCFEITFQICKNPKIFSRDDMSFTFEEQKDIYRWLNRMDFYDFRFIDTEYYLSECWFRGSFNIKKIELAGTTVGLELTFKSDRPFAIGRENIYKFNADSPEKKMRVYDSSDEIGYIYPSLEITCNASGTLKIINCRNNKVTEIKNCISGEVIQLHDLMIETSSETHSLTIMDDFNFVFPVIENTIDNIRNEYTFSLPCSVVFKYKPIRKVGM